METSIVQNYYVKTAKGAGTLYSYFLMKSNERRGVSYH